jgi:hypothetical protein
VCVCRIIAVDINTAKSAPCSIVMPPPFCPILSIFFQRAGAARIIALDINTAKFVPYFLIPPPLFCSPPPPFCACFCSVQVRAAS